MERVSLWLSSIMTVAVFVWDAYCQLHQSDYQIPDVIKGVILAPYGGVIIRKTVDIAKKISKKN